MTTDEIISRCYEHGQPDYVLAADRLKELLIECASLREANNTWVALFGPPSPPNETTGAVAGLCSCKASQRDGQHMAWCPALTSTEGK